MAVSQSLSVTEVADSISTTDNTSKVKIVWKSTQSGESYNNNTKTAYFAQLPVNHSSILR